MLKPKSERLQTLLRIRDLGLPLAREWEREGRLDFNVATHCLLGACRQAWPDGSWRTNPLLRVGAVVSTPELFGSNVSGDLDTREAALHRIIEEELEG